MSMVSMLAARDQIAHRITPEIIDQGEISSIKHSCVDSTYCDVKEQHLHRHQESVDRVTLVSSLAEAV